MPMMLKMGGYSFVSSLADVCSCEVNSKATNSVSCVEETCK